jgi:hypothetical protein
VLSTAVVALTALRLLRAAHSDMTTALAILQNAGTGNMLVGIGLGLLPLVPMLLAVTAVFFGVSGHAGRSSRSFPLSCSFPFPDGEAMTGYVLADDDRRTVMLRETDRKVVIVPEA